MSARYTIKDMQVIAREHEGKCLSKVYMNREAPLAWMCKYGHTWDASYQIILQGGWCMQCARGNFAQARLEAMQELAESRGGKCLSTDYKNYQSRLQWQCAFGHRWIQRAAKVHEGHWCPHCNGKARLTIERMQKIAKEHGGKCLSIKYTNSDTKLKWECSKGHQWFAVPNSTGRGNWCKKCSVEVQKEKIRTPLGKIQKLAVSRGGKLLSKEYINPHIKLRWQCKKKHTWYALYSNIHAGRWCPYCAGRAKLTIEQMQSVARKKGGLYLSSKYVDTLTKSKWKCAKGHIWAATPNSIIYSGTWCPECAKVNISKSLKAYFAGLKTKSSAGHS